MTFIVRKWALASVLSLLGLTSVVNAGYIYTDYGTFYEIAFRNTSSSSITFTYKTESGVPASLQIGSNSTVAIWGILKSNSTAQASSDYGGVTWSWQEWRAGGYALGYPTSTPTPTPTPTPTSTPTPTPTPTPDPNSVASVFHGDIGDGPPAGYVAKVKLTFPDGEVRWADVNSDGTFQYPYYVSEAGQNVKRDVYVYKLDMENPESGGTPANTYDWGSEVVPDVSANWTADIPDEVTLSAPPNNFEYTEVGSTIASDGTVSPIMQISGGSIGTTTIVPNTTGAVVTGITGVSLGTGVGGSFVAAPEASQTNIDLTDVKNLLRAGNIDRQVGNASNAENLSQIAISSAAIASALTRNGTLEALPDETTGKAVMPGNSTFSDNATVALNRASTASQAATALLSASKTIVPGAPTIAAQYGQSLSFPISLPVLGDTTVSLEGYAVILSAFRALVLFVLVTLSWVIAVKILRGAFV